MHGTYATYRKRQYFQQLTKFNMAKILSLLDMTPKKKNTIASTEKSMDIIDALVSEGSCGVVELADHLGYNKTTVYHHLSTLESRDYVIKQNGKYKIGLRFFEIGQHTRRQYQIYKVGKSEIDKLAEETGELANLMVTENGLGIYIYISRGGDAVCLDTKMGSRQYLHMSALGKSILANMSEEDLDAIIEIHGLPQKTKNTVTDRDELEKELEEIRDSGVAFDGEERAEGIRCIAAPVTDQDGNLIGAVSVSGPSTRLDGDHLYETIPKKVKNTAKIIGINTSYQ